MKKASIAPKKSSKLDSPIKKKVDSDRKKLEKTSWMKYSVEEFVDALPNVKTTSFEPFKEGPRRGAEAIVPDDVNLDSPYTLFSLLWPEELWATLATNTNKYALLRGAIERNPHIKSHDLQQKEGQRVWWATNAAEMKVFIGAIIYMGVHREAYTNQYWFKNLNEGMNLPLPAYHSFGQIDRYSAPLHTVSLHLGEVRYWQLLRYFHVSDPYTHPDIPFELQDKMTEEQIRNMWWYKLEPLASILRSNFEKYWRPASNVSIDEMMVRFFGRSLHTVKMPNKPIKQGYKMWALCDSGYLFTFMWNSRVKGIGELTRVPDLTPTASMVLQLASKLPPVQAPMTYTVYLDNYFTSILLFRELRRRGIGACGTTRPNNSGNAFPAVLDAMKDKKYSSKLPWGTLVVIPADDVLCFGWIDNNCVTALSTVHTVNGAYDTVTKLRKKPNDRIARLAFGDSSRAQQPIPRFIDDYNMNMGGVDIADQHRQAYDVQRRACRNWLPNFYWLLDHTVINAYKIGINRDAWTSKGRQHHDFRTRLYQELFDFSSKAQQQRHLDMIRIPPMSNASTEHVRTKLFFRPRTCIWCQFTRQHASNDSRLTSTSKERQFGTELSSNIKTLKQGANRMGL